MAEARVLPTIPSAPNLRPIGWFMAVSGCVIVAVSLLVLALLGGSEPFYRLGKPMLFLLGGFGVLGALTAANGIVTVRTNRRSAAMRNVTLAAFALLVVGLILATRHR